MKVLGKNGSEWVLDESLRKQAVQLINEYPDELGHIDHQRVVFVRMLDKKANWYGKTWFINAPHTILTHYVYEQFAKNQLMVPDLDIDTKMAEFLDNLLTVSYIIALNHESFEKFESGGEELIAKQERNVLIHELMHINPDMVGIRKHDREDFSILLRKFGVDWSEGLYDNDELVMES
jgi:predicted metallopeptidase